MNIIAMSRFVSVRGLLQTYQKTASFLSILDVQDKKDFERVT